MRIDGCRRLRSLLTSYVDDEVTAAERRLVEDHLERCGACRHQLGRERAIRQRLQGWSAEARAEGVPLSWPAASETRPYRNAGARLPVAALVAAAVVVGFLVWNRGRLETGVPLAARGQITDSRCAGHTHTVAEFKNRSGRECVRRCVEMGAQYVFISEGVIYPIRNQDFEDVVRLAGQDVQLEGEVRQKALTVSRVNPLTVSRSNNAQRSHQGKAS